MFNHDKRYDSNTLTLPLNQPVNSTLIVYGMMTDMAVLWPWLIPWLQAWIEMGESGNLHLTASIGLQIPKRWFQTGFIMSFTRDSNLKERYTQSYHKII